MTPHADARRRFLGFLIGGALSATGGCGAATKRPAAEVADPFAAGLAKLEGDGRLGVALLDTADGSIRGRRLDERFAMCSTFKLTLAAMTLSRAARAENRDERALSFGARDLLPHSPVTSAALAAANARGHSTAALPALELARATQTTSDNAAANLLLRELGGPAAFTAFCRSLGDETTRLDRYEPEMNDVRGDDPRDTTTPRAAARLIARLLGDALPPSSRELLREWMIATTTGAKRIRRGLPAAWIAGDKTGTGGGPGVTVKCNDLVWIEPPGRAPLVATAFFDAGVVAEWPSEEQEGVLAATGRFIAVHA